MNEPTVLTVKELTERWRVQPKQVLEFIRSAELRAFDVSRAGSRKPRWRVPMDSVVEFEESRAVQTPTPRVRRRRRAAKPPGWVEYF